MSDETRGPEMCAQTVINAESVVVQATTVTIGKEEGKPDETVRSRYRLNASFLLILTILLTVWFQLHLQTWATQGLIFGTLTVWALWQLVLASAKKDFAKDGEELRKRLLGNEDAGDLLFLACAGTIALLGMTTSVSVNLNDRDTARLRIDLIDKSTGKPFTDSIIVVPSSRVGARLLFPRVNTSKVDIIVVEPVGYEYTKNPVELKPWTGIDLTFGDPLQFKKKKLHAVRIVPGWTLNGMDAPGHGVYDATIKVGRETFVLKDVGFQTIYCGVADDPSLKKIVDAQSNAAFANTLQDHLNNYRGWDAGDEKTYLTEWQKTPRTFTTRDFQSDEKVTVGIGLRNGTPTWSQTVPIAADGEITTIFVEKPL